MPIKPNNMDHLVFDQKALKRFWTKVFKNKNCWMWVGARTATHGHYYGNFHIAGKNYLAHRVAYILMNGEINNDYVIDHICGNGLCVNPLHLQNITNKENILKGKTPSARHAKKTHCSKGHPYSKSNTCKSGNKRYCLICSRRKGRVYHKKKRGLKNA